MVHFNADEDIPDLTGKVILVTGGNSGLGKATIQQLAKHNPQHIFLAARTESKAVAAIDDIKTSLKDAQKTPPPITFIQLDLSSFASIKAAATAVLAQADKLHILINNAGIMATPPGLTREGYEIQFGTNHMGHALLTRLLLPILLATARASTPADVRVVTLTSGGERLTPVAWQRAGTYDFEALRTDCAGSYGMVRYGASKAANVHFATELARRNPEITSVAVHPGVVVTNLGESVGENYWGGRWALWLVHRLFCCTAAQGARNTLWAATTPKEGVKSGEFYFPVGLEGKGSAFAMNADAAGKLWQWTERELDEHA